MTGSWFDETRGSGSTVARFTFLHRADDAFRPFQESDLRQPLLSRFLQEVAERPDKLALVCRRERLSYGQLAKRAAAVAQVIENGSSSRESPVGLMLEPGSLGIIAILASVLANRTYVPLDPAYPVDRVRYMFRDCRAELVLTSREHAAKARDLAGPGAQVLDVESVPAAAEIPCNRAHDGNPRAVYVLYTSGSTGQPKGVMQTERNVLFQVGSHTNNLLVSRNDSLSLLASLSFDAAVTDTFAALSNGATLVITNVKSEGLGRVREALHQARVSLVHATPTVFRSLIASSRRDEVFADVRCIVLGGELVTRGDLESFQPHFQPDCVLVNGYGATEASFALQQHVRCGAPVERDVVPIGYPLDGMRVSLVDEAGEDAQRGEITLEAEFLALGYLGKPAETAAAFGVSARGVRTYKTGDIGERLGDGSVQCVGRIGRQIKIRGHRVELSEIEARLRELPNCVAVAAAKRVDPQGNPCIVAYVVPAGDVAHCELEAKRHLEACLPAYMLPAYWTFLEALPLTPTGKLDYRALPEPVFASTALVGEEPRSETERLIMDAWLHVVGTPIGRQDNFFEAGATSLTLAMLQDYLAQRTALALAIVQFYEHGNVAALAAQLGDTAPLDLAQEADARARLRKARRARVQADLETDTPTGGGTRS